MILYLHNLQKKKCMRLHVLGRFKRMGPSSRVVARCLKSDLRFVGIFTARFVLVVPYISALCSRDPIPMPTTTVTVAVLLIPSRLLLLLLLLLLRMRHM